MKNLGKTLGISALFALAVSLSSVALADRDHRGHHGKKHHHLDYDDRHDRAERHHRRYHRDKAHRHYKKYLRDKHYRKHYRNHHRKHYRRHYRDRYYHHYYNPYRHRHYYRYHPRKHYYRGGHRYYIHNHYDDDYYKWIAGAAVVTELIHHTLPHKKQHTSYKEDNYSHDSEREYQEYYYRRYKAE